jgi:hypothetical protein
MVVGLTAEILNLTYDKTYGAKRDNRLRALILGPFGVLMIFWIFFTATHIATDLYAYRFNSAPLRNMTATITDRSGFPVTFIVPDVLDLSNGESVHLPYSDLPRVGSKYTFTLLPTQNIVLYYQPAK